MAEISLRNSDKKLIVGEDDYEFLSKFIWKIIKKRTEYVHPYSTHFGKIVRPHRLVLNVENPKIMIDHINGNTLDNRKENLRICTAKQNSRNIGKRKGNLTSKYKGVFWNKQAKKWCSKILTDSGRLWLGYFEYEIDAAKAYNEAALKHHKEFARLNEV